MRIYDRVSVITIVGLPFLNSDLHHMIIAAGWREILYLGQEKALRGGLFQGLAGDDRLNSDSAQACKGPLSERQCTSLERLSAP